MLLKQPKVLVVGAGPVGLAASLFLTKNGLKPRIIEKQAQPSIYSKALAVNPRTLDLLESTGATEAFLKNGYKAVGFNFYKNNKLFFKNDFSAIKHKYPFMLFQTQAESESLLATLLEENGVCVERNIELLKVSNDGNNKLAKVSLKHKNDHIEEADFDIIYAADGLKSAVRKSLGVNMIGTKYKNPWYLCDAEIDTDLSLTEAHGFLYDNFIIALLRVKDKTWRIISNNKNYIENIPKNVSIKNIIWESEFFIHHKLIEKFNVGNVYFGGDAAHVHSPFGGRGMNLGIEDAYVFTNLLVSGRLNEYHEKRYKIVKDLVKRIDTFTSVLGGQNTTSRVFLKLMPYIMPTFIKFNRNESLKFLLGLDHPVLK